MDWYWHPDFDTPWRTSYQPQGFSKAANEQDAWKQMAAHRMAQVECLEAKLALYKQTVTKAANRIKELEERQDGR